MEEECDEEIEREEHKKSVKMLRLNCDQVLKEVKKTKVIKLKGRRTFKLEKWLEDETTAEEKDRKHQHEVRREMNGRECGSILHCCLQFVTESELNTA